MSMKNKPVGLIVAENLATAEVFEAFGIDFCCHGHQTLEESCNALAINIEQIEFELKAAEEKSSISSVSDVSNMAVDELACDIVAVHHSYMWSALPKVASRFETVIKVHGARHPELLTIQKDFGLLRDELESHLEKEEKVLFPFIEAMAVAAREHQPRPHSCFDKIADPIAMMKEEHESAGAALERMRKVAGNYQVPPDACNTFRLLYKELQELEYDLHVHIAKENYLLFPKSLKLESEF